MSKPQEIVIDIQSNGVTEAMHFDEFSLGFLGDMTVDRASEIFHNPKTQKWDIVLPEKESPQCEAVSSFNGYDEARKFEVLWLQECRKQRISPYTEEAAEIATQLRGYNNNGEGNKV